MQPGCKQGWCKGLRGDLLPLAWHRVAAAAAPRHQQPLGAESCPHISPRSPSPQGSARHGAAWHVPDAPCSCAAAKQQSRGKPLPRRRAAA